MKLLLLLCFCVGALSTPVSEESNEAFVYTYKGHIDTTTSASDEKLARWTISADLQLTNVEPDYTIVKLINIKTSVFNGDKNNLHNAIEKQIPKEAKILEQPFAFKWEFKTEEYSLFFERNEPLWSVNFKRGITNILNFEFERPDVTPDGEIGPPKKSVRKSLENTIYGKCMEEYTRKSASAKDGVIFERKIDSLNCEQQGVEHLTNTVKAPGVKDFFDNLDFKSIKLLTIKKGSKKFTTEKTVSKSKISYKTSPSALYTHYVDQEQSLAYKETLVSKESVDLSKYNVKRKFAYEFGSEPTSGRHAYEKDSAKLVKQFLKHYDEFNKIFKYLPVENDVRSSDSIYEMYNMLLSVDIEGLKSIEKSIGDKNMDFYFSMLPYVGTNATVEYLTKFYKSDKIKENEEFAARMMTIFPQHIREPSDDKLVAMEGLMKNSNAQKKISKHAAILGFASAVATSCRKDAISKKLKDKYINMFHNKYLDGQDYEEKMVYILGLVNMAKCLDLDFMNSITTNCSEPGSLRALAIKGFKKYLHKYEKTDKIYKIYWPVVQNKSEPLEVRVTALDLLLSSPLTAGQFDTIMIKYSNDLNDQNDKQLANYLLTTLHSIQNSTGYFDHLGGLATEAIKNANIQRFPKSFATGYYRLSYTDSVPNIGAAFEARLITDKTNLVNNVEISFNSFANSFDLGTYTLHLHIQGLYDRLVVKQFLFRKSYTSIPQLLKLLQDYKYKITEFSEERLVDLVLLKNNVAVYGRHWDSFEIDDALEVLEEMDNFILKSQHFSFQVNDRVHIPSQMGTPIIISNYMIDMKKHSKGGPSNGKSLKYRSAFNYLTQVEAYNPIADVNIASYKYHNDESYLNLKFTYTERVPPSLTWKNEKETYSNTWDNNIGTKVEEMNKLKKYCEKCESINKLETSNISTLTNAFNPFGVYFDVESNNHVENYHLGKVFYEVWTEKLHRLNADASPYAGPFLFTANILNYQFWLRSDVSKGSIRSRSFNGLDEVTETTLNIEHNGYTRNIFKSQNLIDIKTDMTVTNLQDKVLSFVNMTFIYDWDPDYVEENTTKQTGSKIIFFNYVYKPSDKKDSFKICGRGETNFPTLRDDRLSIKPYEDTVSETVFIYTKKVDDSEDCEQPEHSYTLKEVYSSSNKKKIMDNKLSKDRKKCAADSKNFKYTAPTEECKRVSNKLTEYDNYRMFLTSIKHLKDHNETISQDEEPIVEFSRTAEDKIRVHIQGLDIVVAITDDQSFSSEFYYPQMTVNPLWLSYSTDESAYPDYDHVTCTITPSTIEKFYGKYVPNQKKEWLAFAECVNSTRMGLNGHTIDDKHVGFTYYNEEVAVVATIKNNRLDVSVNGKQITKYHEEEEINLKVHFLSKNTIYIVTRYLEVYYNTEYVFIRAEPQYPRIFCGVCKD